MDSLKSVSNVCRRKPSFGAADFKPSLNQLISILYTLRGLSALQAINKPDDMKTICQLEFTTSRLATYNKRTNMIKESPLQVCH